MTSEPIIRQVLAAVDRDELIQLTAALVQTNSVWDPAAGTGEASVAKMVASWADQQGFKVWLDEIAPKRLNTVIKWSAGPGSRTLLFEGHTDVVTPGDIRTWRYDPFGAEIVNNRMYGRGTCDTKGNLAAMLIAMVALKRSGVRLNGTILGGVLCDEEDQMLGVKDFIRRGYADSITGAVICEPQDGLVCTTQKGAIRARYTISGKMAHGAMPLSGLSTAPAVSRLIGALNEMEMDIVKDPGKDTLLGWPSVTPTVVQAPPAGTAQLNVLPGKAEILVDVRTVPEQSHPDIIHHLTAVGSDVENRVREYYRAYDQFLDIPPRQDIQVTMEILTDRPCTLTDRNDPVVRAAHWSNQYITRKTPEYAGVLGSTDGTYLWALKNIPIVTMGAGNRHIPHQTDEWVDLDQLLETAQIYALTALHYLSDPE